MAAKAAASQPQKLKTRGLDPGVVHEYRVRACNGRECSAWSPVRAQATLLAVSGAPVHPRSNAIVNQIAQDGPDQLHPDLGRTPITASPT